jgi:hypothetical protein
MVKKYLIVRLQNPEIKMGNDKNANFVVGQEVIVSSSEEEAISEINEIFNGPSSEYLLGEMPTDFGFAIIPYYSKQ